MHSNFYSFFDEVPSQLKNEDEGKYNCFSW